MCGSLGSVTAGGEGRCAGKKNSCSEQRLWELGKPLGRGTGHGERAGLQFRHRLWVRLATVRELVGLGDHLSWACGSGV